VPDSLASNDVAAPATNKIFTVQTESMTTASPPKTAARNKFDGYWFRLLDLVIRQGIGQAKLFGIQLFQ